MKIKEAVIQKRPWGSRMFHILVNTFVMIFIIICIYPLFFILIASISDPSLVSLGKVIAWPKNITSDGYQKVMENKDLWISFRNTIFYTVFGTLFNLALTLTAGFALSRKEMPMRKGIMLIFTITMFINGGLVPTFLLVKGLGLYNNPLVMIFLNGISIYNLIICRTFFESTIPNDLWGAAQVDGCNEFRFFWSIVLPVSGSIIAVLALYYSVYHWNSYFNAMIYLRDSAYYNLQLVLRNILLSNQFSDDLDIGANTIMQLQTMRYAIIVISAIPMLVIYPFVQKHFVKGIMIGSVKG